MQMSLKIFLILITIFYIFVILKAVKKKKIRINYSIFWIIMGIILTVALLIPNLIDNLATNLGFGMPVNMIFCASIFIIFYLIFDLTILVSTEKNKNVTLVQEVSMLKNRIEQLEKNSKED